ncbi:hypothetical protein EYF80_027513 [Liparis tanakae]|uniref:Uncharacterized protein n=1 Tax=Liparis tanakae TaxID=230148 RepID=A0A4Z2H8V1_9TELE|nr:hypothetical protein EYF80_027513 [Liparis tanakae]
MLTLVTLASEDADEGQLELAVIAGVDDGVQAAVEVAQPEDHFEEDFRFANSHDRRVLNVFPSQRKKLWQGPQAFKYSKQSRARPHAPHLAHLRFVKRVSLMTVLTTDHTYLLDLPIGKARKKGSQQSVNMPTTTPKVFAAFFSRENFRSFNVRELLAWFARPLPAPALMGSSFTCEPLWILRVSSPEFILSRITPASRFLVVRLATIYTRQYMTRITIRGM